MPEVDKYLGNKVGDVITLSDLQTQAEFDAESMDFIIKEVRIYEEPNDVFKLTGYLVQAPNDEEQIYMLVVKQVDDEFALFLYYRDGEGDMEELGQNLTDEEQEDFLERIEPTLHLDKGDADVVFDRKQDSTHGVRYNSTADKDESIRTLAEYFTDDECGGNPHAFAEWAGEGENSWFELWYGCELKEHEVEIVPGE